MAEINLDTKLGEFSTVFDKISEKVKSYLSVEYNEGRLTDINYATAQAQAIQTIVSQSVQLLTTMTLLPFEQEGKEIENQIKQYQLSTLLPDEHYKNLKQLSIMDKQIESQEAEMKYTEARKDTVLKSRIDNLLLELMKAYIDKISSAANGGLVPSSNDFENEMNLLVQVWRRVKEKDFDELDNIFLTSTGFKKA
jgi:hypothetical protein